MIQFSESWHLLVDWMTEVEQTLDTHKEIAVSHDEIKQQLIEQKVRYLCSSLSYGLDSSYIVYTINYIFTLRVKIIQYFYCFSIRSSRNFCGPRGPCMRQP